MKLHILTVWHKCSEVWAEVSTVLWRVLEVHFVKVVLFTIFMVCVSEVSIVSSLVQCIITFCKVLGFNRYIIEFLKELKLSSRNSYDFVFQHVIKQLLKKICF